MSQVYKQSTVGMGRFLPTDMPILTFADTADTRILDPADCADCDHMLIRINKLSISGMKRSCKELVSCCCVDSPVCYINMSLVIYE